jgi:hypothetical protein
MVLLVSNYHGHTLELIDRTCCRLVAGDEELARFTLTLGAYETGLVMVKIFCDSRRWRLRAIGEVVAVSIPLEPIDAIKPLLLTPTAGSMRGDLRCRLASRPKPSAASSRCSCRRPPSRLL